MRRLTGLLAAAALAAGCSGLAAGAGGQLDTPTQAPAPDDLAVRPEVEVSPDVPPPGELIVTDLVDGDGPAAGAGDSVTVQYVVAAWSSGRELDASWDHERPYTFELGAGQVIAGFDQGVAGMRVGGRRRIEVPPGLAYGDRGTPTIPAGETLVFLVDLRAVNGETA